MANRRMIYQDFFEDEYFGSMNHTARILWIGLISAMADDQGRMLDNPHLINSKVFIFDPVPIEELHSYLDSFRIANKIVRYEAGGKHLIQIVNWWKYQTPAWASPSKFDPPEGWTDRVKCHVSGPKQGGSILNENWSHPGGFNKELHSYLPSGIDDVNVNDDINVNDDEELSTKNDLFSQCQKIYETKKGRLLSDIQGFVQMINNFKANGVTAEDYAAAIDAMDADPKYKGSRPTSYEKWAIGYAEKRNNPIKQSFVNQDKKVYYGPDFEEIII